MGLTLKQILNGITHDIIAGDTEVEIQALATDSRQVTRGALFIALKGYTNDGHKYIRDAVEKGASAILGEFADTTFDLPGLTLIRVSDSRKALTAIAAAFFDHPYEKMDLIGITGTNGKTTTSYLLESILSASGRKPGVIGTINYRLSEKLWPAPVTTPGNLELMQLLRRMADAGASDVIMEVSSHALDQGRVEGCPFRTAIFTNISRDHLDYHGSMENYFLAKSLLFRNLKNSKNHTHVKAAINLDDLKGEELKNLTPVPSVTFGMGTQCDVRAEQVAFSRNGLTAKLITPKGKIAIQSMLMGNFNIYNILAATAAALCLGVTLEDISSGISALKGVPGRLERVINKRKLTVLVDYAHTPDALLKAITAVSSLVENGRLITVFGCGGDRDKGKRGEMGIVAGNHSDLVVITSDNPRTEDPMAIISQIKAGTERTGIKRLKTLPEFSCGNSGYIIEPDRKTAIQKAVDAADVRDLILIAGKGHEDYQIIGDNKRHFDDRETAAEAAL